MNYKLIQDLDKLKTFIEWLPELKEDEKFYVTLFARKKYCPEISADKGMLKRVLSDKERLIDKIHQMEVQVGAYKFKGEPIPQKALALYITPNPRNMKEACFKVIKRAADLLQRDKNFNIHSEVLNIIQKTPSKMIYLDFDIDSKNFDLSRIKDQINLSCVKLLETRGGYHLLVKLEDIEDQYRKSFYNGIRDITLYYTDLGKSSWVDQVGDQLIPIPGCYQGGFVPQFIDL